MPIDPRRYAMTPDGRTAERLADLERRAGRTDASSLNRAPATHVRRTSSFTLGNTSAVTVTFQDSLFDGLGSWDPATPTLLTLPFEGIYTIVGKAQFDGNGSAGLRSAQAFGLIETGSSATDNAPGTQVVRLTDVNVGYQVAGAQVGLSLQQSSAASETIGGAWLSIVFVGALHLDI